MTDYFAPRLDARAANAVSALGLAHVGDGVYELLWRTWLCTHGTATAKDLHKNTVAHVSAPAQARVMERLLPLLTQEETAVYKRGRNAHVTAVPKNATGGEYARATGLEALFGYLYLTGQMDRINTLFAAAAEEDPDAA